ncbi:MAG: DNA cytosine methyltransferase [Desulfococcaceae bacterium]|jgi:DNA (cytosine-5)-methyltransferase 1|nr:DNA cytosine methyltransferase [Desulfococcaceae bacterium]
MKNISFTGVDIFSGAGGMSLGAEKAGIQVSTAVDVDKYSLDTYQYNHRNTHVICRDIRNIKPSDINNFSRQPFVLFGGPPCQGFSSSYSHRKNDFENPRNWMFKHFIRFVEDLKPFWVVFENVEGFTRFYGGKLVKDLKEALIYLGYKNPYSEVLNAVDFGVPQVRNRFFLVANKEGREFEIVPNVEERVTVGKALTDLPSLKNGDNIYEASYKPGRPSKYGQYMRNNSRKSRQNFVSRNQDYVIERYQHIKPGQNWEAIPDRLMKNYQDKTRCHTGIYKRLDPDEPSVVIANYRKNMLIHPYEDRGLSLREAARLQSFPDDFIFQGCLGSMQQQIGNAVPPLLAEAIFRQIIQLSCG